MTTHANPSISPLVGSSLEQLSDAELLTATRRLVGRSNQLLAALLAHRGEVESRGIHRTRACASLYTYCMYELRLSEDEAFRRVTAARLVRRFPALLDAVASGELHLTGLLLLGPHLTEHNLAEVLARAKHRTKEITRLVREIDPLPSVSARIEPLGPAPRGLVPPRPTWQAFMQALCPVRELEPGDRPRDWTSPIDEPDPVEGTEGVQPVDEATAPEPNGPEPAPARAPPGEPLGPEGDPRRAPQRYKVQFTATEEFVNLVERAKALLSHALSNAGLEEIQLRALRAYVAELEKRRYGAAGGRRHRAGAERSELAGHGSRSGHRAGAEPSDVLDEDSRPCHRAGAEPSDSDTIPPKPRRRRGRHIPAAVRRAVFERDGGRCTYVDASGKRCRETHFLELHHVDAFAKGGGHDADNLTLRCRAHNTLAAEEDFGRDFVEHARDTAAHECADWRVSSREERLL